MRTNRNSFWKGPLQLPRGRSVWLWSAVLFAWVMGPCPASVLEASAPELNREAQPILKISAEIVQMDRQGSIARVDRSRPTTAAVWFYRASEQLCRLAEFKLGGAQQVRISVAADEISPAESRIRLLIEQLPQGRVVKDEKFVLYPLKGQELLVLLADRPMEDTTLAVRLVPVVEWTQAVIDYPELGAEFGVTDALYIVDGMDLRARGLSGYIGGTGVRMGDPVQALVLDDPKLGRFTVSYRPFSGSVWAGYIEGHRMVFEWDGHQFELVDIDTPIMPEGKWSLYVRKEESTRSGIGTGEVTLRPAWVR